MKHVQITTLQLYILNIYNNMQKKIYEYSLDKIFIGETIEKYNQFDNSVILPQFYTEIKPVFNSNTHFAIFDESSQTWSYKEFSPLGVFYNKQNMTQIEVKSQYDVNYSADLYTNIKPLVINEGDSVVFNNSKQEWEYSTKGILTLEKDLIAKKQSVINECTAFYENLRQLQVIAGESSLTIIANEVTSSNIKTWIGAMKHKIKLGDFYSENEAYYEYRGRKISYTECVNLQQHIDYIRTEVVSARDYHIGNVFGIIGKINQIQTIKELENYDYKVNHAGQLMKPFDPIIL